MDDSSKTNVTAMFGVASLPVSYVAPDILRLAEDLLKQVKRGEITSLAVCYVRPNRTVCTDWASGTAPGNLMIAASAQLGFKILKAIAEVSE